MNEYLDNYLRILPTYEAESLKKFLESQNENNYVSEDELQSILNRFTSFGTVISEFVEQIANVDKVSKEEYQKFYVSVYLDLLRLYKESELIENAIVNYDYLHKAELDTLKKEIAELAKRISEIDKTSAVKESIITRTENFSSNASIEKDQQYIHLYKDRDGSTLPVVDFKISNTSNRIINKELVNYNLLRDDDGNVNCSIEVKDKRGIPVPQSQHTIGLAIDNSILTYWGEMVLVDDKINVAITEENVSTPTGEYFNGEEIMENTSVVIPAGGTLSKVIITLAKIERVTQVIINPFTIYPMDIAAIFYKSADGHTMVSISPSAPLENITENHIINMNAIHTKEIIIYIRQRNYTNNTYFVTNKVNSTLWDQISSEEYKTTFNNFDTGSAINDTLDQDRIDEIDGWRSYAEAYKTYATNYKAFIASYNEWATTYGMSTMSNIDTSTNPWANNDTDNTGNPNSPDPANVTTIRYRGYYYTPQYLSTDVSTKAEQLASLPNYYGIYTDNQGNEYVYIKGKYAYIDQFSSSQS